MTLKVYSRRPAEIDWRQRMGEALQQLAQGMGPDDTPPALDEFSASVARQLLARRTRRRSRRPAQILEDWRTVEHCAHQPTPLRHALKLALRAEYASAMRQLTTAAAELADAPWSTADSGAFHDRRAAETADQLVATLWQDAEAAARAAASQPGSEEWSDARAQMAELGAAIGRLELALRERPWTEVE